MAVAWYFVGLLVGMGAGAGGLWLFQTVGWAKVPTGPRVTMT